MHMGRPPTIWVLLGQRAGDNAQAIELARLLGCPAEQKHLRYGAARIIPNLALGASLASLDRAKSDALLPSMARSRHCHRQAFRAPGALDQGAEWRKDEAGPLWAARALPSTGSTSSSRPRNTRFPPLETFVEIPCPPLVPAQQPPHPAHEDCTARFKPLPRPWTGELVGGSRFPFILDETEAARSPLISRMISARFWSRHHRARGGCHCRAEEKLGIRGFVYDWSQGGPNPHQAILDLADTFVVTSDSVSMICRGCCNRRPSRIFELKRRAIAPRWEARQGLAATLARTGIHVPPRDPSRVRIPEHLTTSNRCSSGSEDWRSMDHENKSVG